MNFGFPIQMPEAKKVPKMHRVRCKFTKQEDTLLVNIVNELGTRDWEAIANRIPNRNARQCRERYTNYLAPNLSHDPWTPEEDSLLEQKLKELGAKWVNISKYFKNRTDTMLKNRWLVLSRRSPQLAKHTPNLQNINSSHQKANYKKQQMLAQQMGHSGMQFVPQLQMQNMQIGQIPQTQIQQQMQNIPVIQAVKTEPPSVQQPANIVQPQPVQAQQEPKPPRRQLPSLCNLIGKIIAPLQKTFNLSEPFDIEQFTKNIRKNSII